MELLLYSLHCNKSDITKTRLRSQLVLFSLLAGVTILTVGCEWSLSLQLVEVARDVVFNCEKPGARAGTSSAAAVRRLTPHARSALSMHAS